MLPRVYTAYAVTLDLQGRCYAKEVRVTASCIHSCMCFTVQGELGSKDDTVKELRRWLDQAQGQLQNTQTALHEREAECKTMSADLKAAVADLKALRVRPACLTVQKCQTPLLHLPCFVQLQTLMLVHVSWWRRCALTLQRCVRTPSSF